MSDPFGDAFKGALYRTYNEDWVKNWSPTGCVPIDRAIGGKLSGGFGEGRIHEIFGDWSTGKTLVLYHWMIHAALNGAKCFLFESEGGFDPDWYIALGGIFGTGTDDDLYVYPDLRTVESFFEGCSKIIDTVKKSKWKGPIVIGWDSIAATGTKHLAAEGLDGSRDMTKAFMMSQGTQFLLNQIEGTRISIVATNQTRVNIGAKKWEPTHTPGGRAWPYGSSVRIELKLDGGPAGSRILTEINGDQVACGRYVKGEIIKNKLGTPLRKFKLPLYTEAGLPHPEFKGHLTKVGIDHDEALLTWYLSNPRATFGEERTRYMEVKGGGYIEINPALFNMPVKKFRKKDWLMVLETFPALRNYEAASA
jgi:RecA/RadA recombinase